MQCGFLPDAVDCYALHAVIYASQHHYLLLRGLFSAAAVANRLQYIALHLRDMTLALTLLLTRTWSCCRQLR